MSNQRPIKWANCHITPDEWNVVLATWLTLVDESKIVFGQRPPVKTNMERLIDALKSSDQDFRKNFKTGFPAGSKKYRRLYNYVDRKCQKESG